MGNENCNLWTSIGIGAVTILVHATLLIVFYISLRKQIANKPSCARSRSQSRRAACSTAPAPSMPEKISSVPREDGTVIPVQAPNYAGDSDTSSDSSDSSDGPCQGTQGPKSVNYSTLVFPPTGGHNKMVAEDYENLREGRDYINVDPKKRKHDFWTFTNPAISESVEYTEVSIKTSKN
ncbi:regulator of hemoglobinization and erythroid cell expansion protein [Tachyglossus aculeatus]|uniref:regulator of hemoglobinization and erythroid cell expansion protein n=1 Tax=Tachyglossus aculeatus TaxID=9261 RepID=UPI0018F75C52|nr:regulator of hemoglobinization and erythroid cell expansion protein [Tachyglossus aculeatus]